MAVVGFEPTPPERLEPREPACEGASSEMMEMLEAIANHVRAVQRLGPLCHPDRMQISTPPERLEPREPACEGASSEMMEMLEAIANHVRAVQRLGPLCHPDRMKSTL